MATILVADDFHENRDVLCRMLRLVGHSTISAANGQEALDMAQEHRPDLILMDLSMPIVDGWKATTILKTTSDLRHIPIIAVTGHVTPDEINRAISAGCVDYLAKPVDFERLLGKVASLLGDTQRPPFLSS